MKYRYLILPTLLAIMSVATSCNQEDLPPASPESDVIEITAQIGTTATRVTQTADNVYSFDVKDTVAIVGWYGADWATYPTPWSDADAKWWINSLSVNTGSKWVATPKMRWQNVDELHHFLAWWPLSFTTSANNLSDIKVDMTKMKEKDVLVARKSTMATPGTPVQLQFDHLMARFDVNLSFGGQYDGYNNVSVSLDAATKGTVNLIDAAGSSVVAETGSNTDVQLAQITSAADYSCSALLLPQSLTAPDLKISFNVGGITKSFVYNHPTLSLESGKRTTLNLQVGTDYVYVVSVSVTPWEDGGTIGGNDNVAE